MDLQESGQRPSQPGVPPLGAISYSFLPDGLIRMGME